MLIIEKEQIYLIGILLASFLIDLLLRSYDHIYNLICVPLRSKLFIYFELLITSL